MRKKHKNRFVFFISLFIFCFVLAGSNALPVKAYSSVPDSTLRDILSGKAQIDRCEAATIYGIADALDTTVEDVLVHYWKECLSVSDKEAYKRKSLHDGHTLVLFYSTVDKLVNARSVEDDHVLVYFFSHDNVIDLIFSKGF